MVFERVPVVGLIDRPWSVSQVNEAIRCMYRWHLKYRRGVVAVEKPVPMSLGSLAHLGTEQLFYGKNAQLAIAVAVKKEVDRLEGLEELADMEFREAKNELLSLEDLALELATRAHTWFVMNGWEPLDWGGKLWIEQRVEVDIRGIPMVIIPDFVLVNRHDKRKIVWDAKFRQSTGSFATQETEDMDLQTILYQVGLDSLGLETDGTGILSVLARPQQPVKLNKDGRPSRSLSEQWCTGDAYRHVLLQKGLAIDHEDYADLLLKLDSRRWADAVISPRSLADFMVIWDAVILPRIAAIDEIDFHHRAFGSFECRRCWAREYCLAELRGEDVSVLETDLRLTDDPRFPDKIKEDENGTPFENA